MAIPESDTARARILHVTSERHWRGGEFQLELLVRGLAREFWCSIAVRPGSEAARRLRALETPLHSVPMRGEWDILSGARLRGIARAERIDLLHAHNSRAHALALPVARELGLPLVVSRRV